MTKSNDSFFDKTFNKKWSNKKCDQIQTQTKLGNKKIYLIGLCDLFNEGKINKIEFRNSLIEFAKLDINLFD